MLQKLLVQMQGSKKDSSYQEQFVNLGDERVLFTDFFHRQGIQILTETLVTSCHGNLSLTTGYAEQIEQLVSDGHRVVVTAQGGLYFALPSIVAALAPTIPVISIPLEGDFYGGLVSFLAPQVPSGTASIGGVGVANYQTAANAAAAMLNGDFEGVFVYNSSKKMIDKLEELHVPILGEAATSLDSGLVVAEFDLNGDEQEMGELTIFSPLPHNDPLVLMDYSGRLNHSVYTRGAENVSFLAAKVAALSNESVAMALRKAAVKKAGSYDSREIKLESFTGRK